MEEWNTKKKLSQKLEDKKVKCCQHLIGFLMKIKWNVLLNLKYILLGAC